ncbi:hypothetical protein B0H15DRAFT_382596 [Mycena belliarum]|uniref:Uncharacterized protein n=1 Tax=Mycena belliarum TaxID=1033014 RepID=A0AAD6TZK5_9AGAR|nr:hypothetical protein B0H15DRAFT_382596 [Mycena belliae]
MRIPRRCMKRRRGCRLRRRGRPANNGPGDRRHSALSRERDPSVSFSTLPLPPSSSSPFLPHCPLPSPPMPPRPPPDRDFEPLRASVLDVFAQLGAFDDDSGLVEWMFPEVSAEKELRRAARVRTPPPAAPEPAPAPPPRRRFFGLGTRARSRSVKKDKDKDKEDGGEKEKEKEKEKPGKPAKLKPKKTRSSPDLRAKAKGEAKTKAAKANGAQDATEPKDGENGEDTPAPATPKASVEQKRRLSIFPRKLGASLDQPRPSLGAGADDDWQRVSLTGSLADYATNPFLGTDPAVPNNDVRTRSHPSLLPTLHSLLPTLPTRPIRMLLTLSPADPNREAPGQPLLALRARAHALDAHVAHARLYVHRLCALVPAARSHERPHHAHRRCWTVHGRRSRDAALERVDGHAARDAGRCGGGCGREKGGGGRGAGGRGGAGVGGEQGHGPRAAEPVGHLGGRGDSGGHGVRAGVADGRVPCYERRRRGGGAR